MKCRVNMATSDRRCLEGRELDRVVTLDAQIPDQARGNPLGDPAVLVSLIGICVPPLEHATIHLGIIAPDCVTRGVDGVPLFSMERPTPQHPADVTQRKWWDGEQWTVHVQRQRSMAVSDPSSGVPPDCGLLVVTV